MSHSPEAIRAALDGHDGFVTGLRLMPDELARVSGWIERQWLENLTAHVPTHVETFRRLGLARYHEHASAVAHAAIWPKRARILPAEAVAEIRASSLFGSLREAFGDVAISDEERSGREEIYWRLVRPGEPSDVGSLHADAWFWELGHGAMPPGRQRVKVWVAVVTEPGRNGLRVVPGSHLRDWRFHGERRDGKRKPQLDERESDLDLQLLPIRPGEAVVFHDRLLHGGAPNLGTTTRVSFEFTLFV